MVAARWAEYPELEAVPVAVVITDIATQRAQHVNHAAARLVGCPADDLLDQDLRSYIAPADHPKVEAALALLDDRVVDRSHIRIELVRSDRSTVDVAAWACLTTRSGNPHVLWLIAPDPIAEQVRARCGVPAGFVMAVTDHDWTIDFISGLEPHDDANPQHCLGAPILELIHPSSAIDLVSVAFVAMTERRAPPTRIRLRVTQDEWNDRIGLVFPLCAHTPPRLGLVALEVTQINDVDSITELMELMTLQESACSEALNRGGPATLSARQSEVLAELVKGTKIAQIASALFISESTVRNHLSAIYRAFGVHSRSELLSLVLRTQRTYQGRGL